MCCVQNRHVCYYRVFAVRVRFESSMFVMFSNNCIDCRLFPLKHIFNSTLNRYVKPCTLNNM